MTKESQLRFKYQSHNISKTKYIILHIDLTFISSFILNFIGRVTIYTGRHSADTKNNPCTVRHLQYPSSSIVRTTSLSLVHRPSIIGEWMLTPRLTVNHCKTTCGHSMVKDHSTKPMMSSL